MKVTRDEHGITRELKLGEFGITSHVYHGYHKLHIELEDCSLVISPRWKNGNQRSVTDIAITAKTPHTVKHEKKYVWVTMYPDKKKIDAQGR